MSRVCPAEAGLESPAVGFGTVLAVDSDTGPAVGLGMDLAPAQGMAFDSLAVVAATLAGFSAAAEAAEASEAAQEIQEGKRVGPPVAAPAPSPAWEQNLPPDWGSAGRLVRTAALREMRLPAQTRAWVPAGAAGVVTESVRGWKPREGEAPLKTAESVGQPRAPLPERQSWPHGSESMLGSE
jgi:hypothetical protein